MKAREWHERGKQATDPIEAFSSFWRAFNNLYFGVCHGQERVRIKFYLRGNVSEAAAQQLLASCAEQIDYLFSQPIIDMRGNGRDTAPHVEAFGIAADPVTKVEELFMVIYQVRCNLEHGQKSPRRERDVRLCLCGAPIVAEVVQQGI